MANYASTVTTPMANCERISRSLGVIAGKVTISNYNTTLLEITGITKFFKNSAVVGFTKGVVSVACEGFTSNGYLVRWDNTTGAFRCFYANNAMSIPVDSNVASGAALIFQSGGGAAALHATSAVGNITVAAAAALEVANDVNIGDVNFVAIGFRGA